MEREISFCPYRTTVTSSYSPWTSIQETQLSQPVVFKPGKLQEPDYASAGETGQYLLSDDSEDSKDNEDEKDEKHDTENKTQEDATPVTDIEGESNHSPELAKVDGRESVLASPPLGELVAPPQDDAQPPAPSDPESVPEISNGQAESATSKLLHEGEPSLVDDVKEHQVSEPILGEVIEEPVVAASEELETGPSVPTEHTLPEAVTLIKTSQEEIATSDLPKCSPISARPSSSHSVHFADDTLPPAPDKLTISKPGDKRTSKKKETKKEKVEKLAKEKALKTEQPLKLVKPEEISEPVKAVEEVKPKVEKLSKKDKKDKRKDKGKGKDKGGKQKAIVVIPGPSDVGVSAEKDSGPPAPNDPPLAPPNKSSEPSEPPLLTEPNLISQVPGTTEALPSPPADTKPGILEERLAHESDPTSEPVSEVKQVTESLELVPPVSHPTGNDPGPDNLDASESTEAASLPAVSDGAPIEGGSNDESIPEIGSTSEAQEMPAALPPPDTSAKSDPSAESTPDLEMIEAIGKSLEVSVSAGMIEKEPSTSPESNQPVSEATAPIKDSTPLENPNSEELAATDVPSAEIIEAAPSGGEPAPVSPSDEPAAEEIKEETLGGISKANVDKIFKDTEGNFPVEKTPGSNIIAEKAEEYETAGDSMQEIGVVDTNVVGASSGDPVFKESEEYPAVIEGESKSTLIEENEESEPLVNEVLPLGAGETPEDDSPSDDISPMSKEAVSDEDQEEPIECQPGDKILPQDVKNPKPEEDLTAPPIGNSSSVPQADENPMLPSAETAAANSKDEFSTEEPSGNTNSVEPLSNEASLSVGSAENSDEVNVDESRASSHGKEIQEPQREAFVIEESPSEEKSELSPSEIPSIAEIAAAESKKPEVEDAPLLESSANSDITTESLPEQSRVDKPFDVAIEEVREADNFREVSSIPTDPESSLKEDSAAHHVREQCSEETIPEEVHIIEDAQDLMAVRKESEQQEVGIVEEIQTEAESTFMDSALEKTLVQDSTSTGIMEQSLDVSQYESEKISDEIPQHSDLDESPAALNEDASTGDPISDAENEEKDGLTVNAETIGAVIEPECSPAALGSEKSTPGLESTEIAEALLSDGCPLESETPTEVEHIRPVEDTGKVDCEIEPPEISSGNEEDMNEQKIVTEKPEISDLSKPTIDDEQQIKISEKDIEELPSSQDSPDENREEPSTALENTETAVEAIDSAEIYSKVPVERESPIVPVSNDDAPIVAGENVDENKKEDAAPIEIVETLVESQGSAGTTTEHNENEAIEFLEAETLMIGSKEDETLADADAPVVKDAELFISSNDEDTIIVEESLAEESLPREEKAVEVPQVAEPTVENVEEAAQISDQIPRDTEDSIMESDPVSEDAVIVEESLTEESLPQEEKAVEVPQEAEPTVENVEEAAQISEQIPRGTEDSIMKSTPALEDAPKDAVEIIEGSASNPNEATKELKDSLFQNSSTIDPLEADTLDTSKDLNDESNLPVAEIATGVAMIGVVGVIAASLDSNRIADKDVVDEPKELDIIAEKEAQPLSPKSSNKHRSSRHSTHSSRHNSSKEKEIPIEESHRSHSHRKRRDSGSSLKAMFIPANKKKPDRHDSGYSQGSNGMPRKQRTSQEQVAHDKRKAEYRAMKAKLTDTSMVDEPAIPSLRPKASYRSPKPHSAVSHSSKDNGDKGSSVLDIKKGESIVKAPFIAKENEPHIKEERREVKKSIMERPRFSVDGERPSAAAIKEQGRVHSHRERGSRHSRERGGKEERHRRERDQKEKYKEEKHREARKVRREAEKQSDLARGEVAEIARLKREQDDEERRIRREERRKRRAEEDKAAEEGTGAGLEQERVRKPRTYRPKDGERPERSSRHRERYRESDSPKEEKSGLKSLWSSAKKVFS